MKNKVAQCAPARAGAAKARAALELRPTHVNERLTVAADHCYTRATGAAKEDERIAE